MEPQDDTNADVDKEEMPDLKVVVVLSGDLDASTALNVVGHLSVCLGAFADGRLMGRATLLDASGVSHRGVAQHPFITLKAKPSHVRKTVELAREEPDLFLADYPREMLTTADDDELHDALLEAQETDLEYLGCLLYGPADVIDPMCRRFSLWR
jgi:hypothetical protein